MWLLQEVQPYEVVLMSAYESHVKVHSKCTGLAIHIYEEERRRVFLALLPMRPQGFSPDQVSENSRY